MNETKRIQKILLDYKDKLEELGYNVVYVALYGSQNYNLTHNESDIDARAIVIPTLRDLLKRKTVSKTLEMSDGLVDVKDLLTFAEVVAKGNPSFVECLDTEYYVGDERIRELFTGIKVNPMAFYGTAAEKLKAIELKKHGYNPTFEQYGYDTKQLHHIKRTFDLLVEYKQDPDTPSFLEYSGEQRDELMDIKRGVNAPSYEQALLEGSELVAEMREIALSIPYERKSVPDKLYDYVAEKIKSQF